MAKTDINKALGIFSKMTPAQQAAAKKNEGIMGAFKKAGTTLPDTKPVVEKQKHVGAVDSFVGDNTGGISGESAALYGFGRKEPTVATAENPVVDINLGGDAAAHEFDASDPQDFLFRMDAKRAVGGTLSENEIYNYLRAQKANASLPGQDPQSMVQTNIDSENARLAELQAKKAKDDSDLMAIKELQLKKKFEIMRQDQTDSADREKKVTQSATSFSGFGRSTFSADQQVEIQKRADRAIEALGAQEQLELEAYRMQLAGAEPEAMEVIRTRISEMQQLAAELKADAIRNAAEMSDQAGAGYQETVNNLMSAAGAVGMDTDQAEQRASAMRGMAPEQQADYLAGFSDDEQLLLIGLSNAAGGDAPKIQKIGKDSYGYFDNATGDLVRIGWGGGGTGSGGGSSLNGTIPTSKMTSTDKAMLETINALKGLSRAVRIGGSDSLIGDIGQTFSGTLGSTKSNIDYIMKNLTLQSFQEAKAKGGSFGAMSNAEWDILGQAASKLNPKSTDEDWNYELGRIENIISGKYYDDAAGSNAVAKQTTATDGDTAVEETTVVSGDDSEFNNRRNSFDEETL